VKNATLNAEHAEKPLGHFFLRGLRPLRPQIKCNHESTKHEENQRVSFSCLRVFV